MIKKLTLSALVLALTGLAQPLQAQMVNPEAGVVVGYWHNWCDGSGYKGGVAPCVKLSDVNPMYNVVDISFMKVYDTAEGRIPTFRLDPQVGLSEAEFIAEIAELNRQGRAVLLALGGADAHIELKTGDEQVFADELIRLTDIYGFDGLDIDLEQAAVTAADNQTVIPAALIMVKEHYRAQGKNFLITMAPEFPYLTTGGKYVPYLERLEGYYDWINPQFYNQGGDGIWIDGVGWVAQNNDELKQEFIYYIADSLINGSRSFYKIPHDKLVFGIPTSNDAAATGYVKNPQHLYSAFEALKNQGQPLRGVMTWSVNWDMGRDAAGNEYNESFIKAYGPFVHSQVPPVPEAGKPVFTGLGHARVLHATTFDPMAGVTAMDTENGDLTSRIVIEGQVDTNTLGEYVLTYRVSDNDDNETVDARKVEVYSVKPVFSGLDNRVVPLGAAFDPLADVTAFDAEDGDITAQIQVSGKVDVNTIGRYSLTYSVTDNAGQQVTASRQVRVTDDSQVCGNAWQADKVYLADEVVSHQGKSWSAGWWTQGDEPGSTGEWGVWRVAGDSDCDGGVSPELPKLSVSLSGIAAEYHIKDGAVDLAVTVKTNRSAMVAMKVTDTGGMIVNGGDFAAQIAAEQTVNLSLAQVIAGEYRLQLAATDTDGNESKQAFTLMLKENEPLPPGDYPAYVAGTQYAAGDMVTGSDGNIYQCKPWPYTAWCASAAYAPGASAYWMDAWDAR